MTDNQGHGSLERWIDLHRPGWAASLEARMARALPGPDAFALIKLAAVTPLVFLILNGRGDTAIHFWMMFLLFLSFLLLDWLARVAARERAEAFGRILDRLADYPLLLVVVWFCLEVLPAPLLILKVLIDFVILALYLLGKGSPQNRLRNGVNYATLFALTMVGMGKGGPLTPEMAGWLLAANIFINAAAALYNLNILQKRFIADALSAGNLLCGVASMVFAARGRYEVSLLFLMLGAAFDGFDGAAARRFGGTSWGVYSDDVADAVNYGIAPGFALFVALPGIEGWIIGPFYTIFTLSRLVFFTLNKSEGDPNFFCGVPSTLGGLISLCAIILFRGHPALVGLLVGIAGVLMVTFDTHYRHLGRALGAHQHAFYGMPFLLILLLGSGRMFGVEAPVALVLLACLGYGFKPNLEHLREVVKNYRESGRKSG